MAFDVVSGHLHHTSVSWHDLTKPNMRHAVSE